MNVQKLGQRIKEARLAKKMTQSEVVGTFITRNMLSQIESGVASPSVKTLEYLAEVLEIPISELVADTAVNQRERLLHAKSEFRSGRYKKVIEIIGEPLADDIFYDEYCALLAVTYLKLKDDKSARRFASLGIYADK